MARRGRVLALVLALLAWVADCSDAFKVRFLIVCMCTGHAVGPGRLVKVLRNPGRLRSLRRAQGHHPTLLKHTSGVPAGGTAAKGGSGGDSAVSQRRRRGHSSGGGRHLRSQAHRALTQHVSAGHQRWHVTRGQGRGIEQAGRCALGLSLWTERRQVAAAVLRGGASGCQERRHVLPSPAFHSGADGGQPRRCRAAGPCMRRYAPRQLGMEKERYWLAGDALPLCVPKLLPRPAHTAWVIVDNAECPSNAVLKP